MGWCPVPEEHSRPWGAYCLTTTWALPSPVSQTLPVGLGLRQLQQSPAPLFPALGCGDTGSPLSDGQVAAKKESGIRAYWSTLMCLEAYRAVLLAHQLWAPGASALSVNEFAVVAQAPHCPETEP